jgi:hypothetical protein
LSHFTSHLRAAARLIQEPDHIDKLTGTGCSISGLEEIDYLIFADLHHWWHEIRKVQHFVFFESETPGKPRSTNLVSPNQKRNLTDSKEERLIAMDRGKDFRMRNK